MDVLRSASVKTIFLFVCLPMVSVGPYTQENLMMEYRLNINASKTKNLGPVSIRSSLDLDLVSIIFFKCILKM